MQEASARPIGSSPQRVDPGLRVQDLLSVPRLQQPATGLLTLALALA